jgi:hypothetical protein
MAKSRMVKKLGAGMAKNLGCRMAKRNVKR